MAVVALSADRCERSADNVCKKMINEAGTIEVGDGRYVAAACDLMKAYGANKAVNNGKASVECEKAHEQGLSSPSTGEVSDGAEACQKSTEAAM